MPRLTFAPAGVRRAGVVLATLCALVGAQPLVAAPALAPNGGAACETPKAQPAGLPATSKPTATTAASVSDAGSGVVVLGGATPTAASDRSARLALSDAPGATPTALSDANPPVSDANPAVSDANAALTDQLGAVVRALGACLSAGKAETVAALATDDYLGQLYSLGGPLPKADYLKLAPQLGPIPTDVRGVKDGVAAGPDRATAVVTQVVGNQLLESRMTFVRNPNPAPGASPWQVDREEPLGVTPPRGSHEIKVTLNDYSFALDPATVKGPDVVLTGTNESKQDHEMLVLQFGDGKTLQDFLQATGPGLPDWTRVVGQATVPAGGRASMTLVDLPAGSYDLVCLFTDNQGQLHAALGMHATFTVS
ncbi:MAG TPA: hypothetical protein VFU81_12220 [Thermomicrobiales bacterium]|nr:hypothetical protein [Thermomicrobiales bacterium]